MFVISIVSAAARSGKSFPSSAPAAPVCTGSASAAGSACRVRELPPPASVCASGPERHFPHLRRNMVQSYAIAPNKQSASAKFRTRNRVPQPTKPPPVSGTPPLFAGENSPAATARKNRTIPQTVPRFDPRFSPRGRTAYAAIRQPVSRAHLGHQRSRRAASSASQCSKYSTTWLTT